MSLPKKLQNHFGKKCGNECGFNLSNVSLLECGFFILEICSILSLYETQSQLSTGDTCCDFSMLEFLKRKIYPKVNNKYENTK